MCRLGKTGLAHPIRVGDFAASMTLEQTSFPGENLGSCRAGGEGGCCRVLREPWRSFVQVNIVVEKAKNEVEFGDLSLN